MKTLSYVLFCGYVFTTMTSLVYVNAAGTVMRTDFLEVTGQHWTVTLGILACCDNSHVLQPLEMLL